MERTKIGGGVQDNKKSTTNVKNNIVWQVQLYFCGLALLNDI